jgi:hypothetical protein
MVTAGRTAPLMPVNTVPSDVPCETESKEAVNSEQLMGE